MTAKHFPARCVVVTMPTSNRTDFVRNEREYQRIPIVHKKGGDLFSKSSSLANQ